MIRNNSEKINRIKPEYTGLELIIDNRSGACLEIVIPVFNEEKRIVNILNYYKEFDIVLLDGGSTDKTIDIAFAKNASVFSRLGMNIGENHFVYYLNNLTKSGRCFYMSGDDYVERSELKKVSELLVKGDCQIYGRRIDWFYGIKASKPTCLLPKGFNKGDAVYDPTNLHDTLSYARQSTNKLIVDVQHLHIFSMKDDYGKFGNYIYHEVSQLRKSANPIKAFMVRFLKLGRDLQLGFVRFPKKFWLIIFLLAQFFASFFLFLMSFIEQSKLNTKDEQIKKYEKMYQITNNL